MIERDLDAPGARRSICLRGDLAHFSGRAHVRV
jgi:hypothetical protein